MADEGKLVVKGREYPIPENFKLGELRVIKRLTGKDPEELGKLKPTDPDFMVALLWVAMHREDPRVTVEEVEELTFDDFEEEVPDSPPAEAAGPDTPRDSKLVAVAPGPSASEPTDQETTRSSSGAQSS